MKRAVVLGDSLALPRIVEEDTVRWEQTWPVLLETAMKTSHDDFTVINCSTRARVITSLLYQDFLEHIVFKEPDVVIVQIGVVDAAPRIFSLREQKLMKMRFFPDKLRDLLIKRREKNRARITSKNPLAKVYTKPKRFQEGLLAFHQKLQSEYKGRLEKLVFLPILAHLPFMEKDSPEYGNNLRRYNDIIQSFCSKQGHGLIKVPEDFMNTASNFCSDGYHLSFEGNKTMATAIQKHLVA